MESEKTAADRVSLGVPVAFVPTPTKEYRTHRKIMKATVEPGRPVRRKRIPHPKALKAGSRVLIWKQDPSVTEIGVRKAFLSNAIFAGPKDARIVVQGVAPVSPNAMGDFIQTPGTEAFDAVHTYAVVRQALTMWQRFLHPGVAGWQWNSSSNTEPIKVLPYAGETMNAYYSRQEKVLKFFYFNEPGTPPGPPWVHTCRSLDIVAHEAGHAILDGLKPGWLGIGNPPQTGGLHEALGDCTAIFLALSQFDQVEAVIAQTKANLHDKTFLADLAEQFGLALGRPNGLRNADNDLKLSEAESEVHAISQVFTGAIYDIIADIFAFERKPLQKDDAQVLFEAAQYVAGLVIRAVVAAPEVAASYSDVANKMLSIAFADGKPVHYRNFIRNRFAVREVIVSPTPLDVDHEAGIDLAPGVQDAPDAVQDRVCCCGTMQLPEYVGADELLELEIEEFKRALDHSDSGADHAGHGLV